MGNFLTKKCRKSDKRTPLNPEVTRIRQAKEQVLLERLEASDDDSQERESDSAFPAEDETDAVDGIQDVKWTPATGRLGRANTILSDTYEAAKDVDPHCYKYPFENIVLEGGGNKGLAYCGAVRVLEDIEIWPQIRRIAGASAGAMTACLLVVGYNSYEIEEFLSQDLSTVFLDHSCGILSLIPNLIQGYGWNPGKRIFRWFGEKLEAKTGSADITFGEVYDKFHKELCIVVTNLNQMCTEYCHPKTTPDMPIRLAARMSMAIPGMFKASRYSNHGNTDTYVDGGVLCNYPIHCFDGWWLSMKPEDSFIQRLQPLNRLPFLYAKRERFGTYNEKTVGLQLYADAEQDLLRYSLESRVNNELPPLPDTKLAKEKLQKKKDQDRAVREHRRIAQAVDAFLKVLREHNLDGDDSISIEELRSAFKDTKTFPKHQAELLFGKDITADEAFVVLDKDMSGQIKFHELVSFIEENGISLQTRFLGYHRREVKSVMTFFSALQSSLLTNVKCVYVEERDIKRTVGINTGHVGTTDFKLEEADRAYVIEQGRQSTLAFLRYHILEENPPRKSESDLENATHATPQSPVHLSASLLADDKDTVTTADVTLELEDITSEQHPFIKKSS